MYAKLYAPVLYEKPFQVHVRNEISLQLGTRAVPYFYIPNNCIHTITVCISKKFSTLYGLIRNCMIIKFRHSHYFATSAGITGTIPCPNPFPSEKYANIRSKKQSLKT